MDLAMFLQIYASKNWYKSSYLTDTIIKAKSQKGAYLMKATGIVRRIDFYVIIGQGRKSLKTLGFR
jgi:hypothetical protein